MSTETTNHRMPDPTRKYRPSSFGPGALADRQWPDRVLERAPVWCSVDLRDGNQALVEPMGTDRKRLMWKALREVGFGEIEVGFPSASQADFDFVRWLVEAGELDDHVTIQVLTQAREDLITKTFDALEGVPRAIVHLYNSTSELQRRVVFERGRPGIVDIAVEGATLVRALAERRGETEFVFEYSPESFTGTELDFAVEICESVMAVWEPTPEAPVILNLPATVEMTTPNVFADQIEWFGRNVSRRDAIVLSVHPHNDRGCAVAAAELAVLAGADRVEGTLFGNGERTGNVDLVTLAMNLYTQGIDPQLDFSDIRSVVEVVEHCNRLPVHERHPYAGHLVFTAFSGSHQDAIRKGIAARERARAEIWEVPYLPIDPADVGRDYEPVIRINSQSGKGGVAFVMEHEHGFELPRRLQIEFSKVVQLAADETGEEVDTEHLGRLFAAEYLAREEPYAFVEHEVSAADGDERGPRVIVAAVKCGGKVESIQGYGNGPIDAFVDALARDLDIKIGVGDFHEHALSEGAEAEAVAYVECSTPEGKRRFGVGRDGSIVIASLRAIVCAVNRLID